MNFRRWIFFFGAQVILLLEVVPRNLRVLTGSIGIIGLDFCAFVPSCWIYNSQIGRCIYLKLLGLLLILRHCILQFQVGAKLPTTYAFALVESCQNNRIVLRMYLAGEFKHGKKDVTEISSRLSSVRSLITSVNEADRLFYSLKVKWS